MHAPVPILMYTNLAQTLLGLLGSLLLCQVTDAVTLAHCVICEFCWMLQNCLGFKALFERKMWLATVKWLFIWLIHLSFNLVDECAALAWSQAFHLWSYRSSSWDFWCWYEITCSFWWLLTLWLLFCAELGCGEAWSLDSMSGVRGLTPHTRNTSLMFWLGKDAHQWKSGNIFSVPLSICRRKYFAVLFASEFSNEALHWFSCTYLLHVGTARLN